MEYLKASGLSQMFGGETLSKCFFCCHQFILFLILFQGNSKDSSRCWYLVKEKGHDKGQIFKTMYLCFVFYFPPFLLFSFSTTHIQKGGVK